jgi:hypothetical protein
VCFEESRDISLWIKLRQGQLPLFDALEAITLSRKKFELNYLNQPSSHIENWHKGYLLSNRRPAPIPLQLSPLLNAVQTPAEAYALYFDVRRDKTLRPHVLALLEDIANRTKNERLRTFLKYRPETSYDFLVCFELLIGMYSSEAKDRHPRPIQLEPFLPVEKKYYHDVHTSKGKAILRQNFRQRYQARNFQNGDMDLRFSGSLLGVLHRERAFQQHGSMKNPAGVDWSWSDIAISDTDYELALQLEQYFYPFMANLISNTLTNRVPNCP